MVKEIVAWSIMSSLAHGERTGASVGDKAVLVISFAIFHPCGVFNRWKCHGNLDSSKMSHLR